MTDVVVDKDRDEVEIRLGKALELGTTYNISVAASGRFGNPSNSGLVRASFHDNGEQKCE